MITFVLKADYMAPRLLCGWFAAAFLTVFIPFGPEEAQASPLVKISPGRVEPSAGEAAFRGFGLFRGGRAPRAHRSFTRRPGGTGNRHLWARHPRSGDHHRMASRDTPPAGNGGTRYPRRPGNGPGWTSRGPRWNVPFPIPPGYVDPGLAGTANIIGAGGNSRSPIAPRFTGAPGQQPGVFADALLNNKRHRARELLVEVNADTADGLREQFAREYGVRVRDIGRLELAGVRIWHLTLQPGQNLRELLVGLLQDPRVLTAQPNYIYIPTQGTCDGGRAPTPDRTAIRPAPAAGLPTGAGVKLAIIDTCVEGEHPELRGSAVSSFDAVQSASSTCEPENHGTAVASLIAGHYRLRGTAASASLLLARAFAFTSEEKENAATSREIVLSLDWAARSGAQLMNLSFAGPADPLVEQTIAAAYRKGIVLVAAAGNAGPASQPLYPAAYPEVIAVTATDGRREIYNAANRGNHISVSARGVDVLVAHIHDTYGTDSCILSPRQRSPASPLLFWKSAPRPVRKRSAQLCNPRPRESPV